MARREDFRRIGLLLPFSNTVQEPDFYKALPPGITLHTTRLQLRNIEAESTLRIVEQIEDASRKLADADRRQGANR
jgi:maleate cis-trans isomerase